MGVGLSQSESGLLRCLPVVAHAPTHARLFALGIRGVAITGGGPFNALQVEPVCFMPGDRFEFAFDMRDASGHSLAIIIPVRDESGETIDLAAWRMSTNELATWRGVATMLGEDEIWAPRIEVDGLRVFPGPAEWLRADRQGVVILDATRARWRLAGERLIVADDVSGIFGPHLRASLQLPAPNIFVEINQRPVE